MELARRLAEGIQAHKPDAKIPRDLQSWAREFDLMLRVDKRPRDAVTAVIDFATTNTFWRRVVFSADKLRQKFDTLDCQVHEPVRPTGPGGGHNGQLSSNRRGNTGGGRGSAGSSSAPRKFTDEWYEERERVHKAHGLGSAAAG